MGRPPGEPRPSSATRQGEPRASKSHQESRPVGEPADRKTRTSDEAVARMAAVLETMDAAVVGASPEGVIRSWNRGAERLFGFEPREVIGKRLDVLAPPEYAEELAQLHERMLAGESVSDYETLRLRKDGTPVYVAITQSPYRDAGDRVAGYSVIAQDMTERIRAEEAVVQGSKRYKELLDGLPIATFRVSTEGLVLDANPACAALLKVADRAAMVNRHAADFFSEPRQFARLVASLREKGVVAGVQMELRRADGAALDVLATARTILDDEGRQRGYLGIFEDISDRVAREEQTERLAVLQELVIRILGHDLKAPIAVIQGHLELAQAELTRGSLDEAKVQALQRRLRRAGEASASMLVTLANARAISRLTMGGDESAPPEAVDLARIVTETVTILRPLAEARQQVLRVEAPRELRVELPPGFESVVGNLLTNAIKYTPTGGRIDLTLRAHGGRTTLEVMDTGPGIAKEMRPRLFRKFERLQEELSVGSHGLGLSIAYSVVELARGTIAVHDRPDGATGALFRVEIPGGGAPDPPGPPA
ncbi:MAG TPA: PAS domain S-box protein [Candidatus Thermoplasmatota archaeon]